MSSTSNRLNDDGYSVEDGNPTGSAQTQPLTEHNRLSEQIIASQRVYLGHKEIIWIIWINPFVPVNRRNGVMRRFQLV